MFWRVLAVASVVAGSAAAEGGFPEVGGAFSLTTQTGETRTEIDPSGAAQLLFFGYANCQEICSAALPLMAEVADLAGDRGLDVTPVMITVDPVRDTVEDMGEPLALIDEDLIGLTGTEAELQIAYDAYGIEIEELFVDPFYGPVFAHGSFIYLLDAEGEVLTMLPPILPAEQLVQIVLANAGETS